ncbi:hypothetical protein A4A49_17898 [Nicotiana attenuata]|uniref:Uncharacterized protein n=1 Tax=Nicotiana attenuata TaxID=49451 RepID=A0A314L787_NICAT|nr:hypothetical protein A4A49_17898 [Nicotiana attenuata]
MATAPPSTAEKPPDHPQNELNTITHPNQEESFHNSFPIATDFQSGAAIAVAPNLLGTSENSQVISGSNPEFPDNKDCSSPQDASFHQISAHSTMGIVPTSFSNLPVSLKSSEMEFKPTKRKILDTNVFALMRTTLLYLQLHMVSKALSLDLASFRKIRGSVAKVKMQIDLTKEKPTHVWLGYDEDQGVNGDGKWMDLLTPATTLPTSATVLGQQPIMNEVSEDLSSEEDPLDPLNDELRRLAKGKAHAASDFNVQSPKSKNKPSQKERQAVRKQNTGICINEPYENPSDSPFQGPLASRRGNHDLCHANRSQRSAAMSQLYKDPDSDPTLTQPGDTQFLNGNESDIPTNDENHTSKTHKATSAPTSTPSHLHPLEMVLEEYPLNRYTPQQDEYKPIEFEDEIIGEQDVDKDSSDEDLEKEQYCDLLITAVNGVSNQKQKEQKVASATVPSRRSPPPRLTRSRAARSSSVPPKQNLKPPSND